MAGLLDFSGIKDGSQPAFVYSADEYAVNPSARRPELRAAPETVLPSNAFWSKYVSEDPAYHDRVGRGQAAILGGLNGLGFGFPMALAKVVAPEKAEGLQRFLDYHKNARLAGEVAGAVTNPMNGVYRAAGNALAARGRGIGVQAGADAATATAIHGTRQAIEGSPQSHMTATIPMAARFMMPALPTSMLERAAKGAVAGAASEAPIAAMTPTQESGVPRLLEATLLGAGHSAGLRARGAPKADASDTMERTLDAAWKGSWPGLLGNSYGWATSPTEKQRWLRQDQPGGLF